MYLTLQHIVKIALLWMGIASCIQLYGQSSPRADSLTQVIINSNDDSERIKAVNGLVQITRRSDPDSAF